MTRLIAVVSTLSILGYLLVHFLSGPAALAQLLFGTATVAITTLLVRVYAVVSRFEGAKQGATRQYRMRTHILLHLIPSSYLVMQFFIPPSLFVNALYLAPVILFFLTGRLTWRTLHKQFGSKMYLIFYKGNTGMIVGLTVLLGAGVLYNETFGSVFFRRALLTYFTIHLLLIGAAVMKIEKDFSAGDAVGVPV